MRKKVGMIYFEKRRKGHELGNKGGLSKRRKQGMDYSLEPLKVMQPC
jgi:hypothetical protein